jgi:hypothetical protein
MVPMGPDMPWVGERPRVGVEGHRGRVVLDAPPAVELAS